MPLHFVGKQHQFTGGRRLPLEVRTIHSGPQTIHVPLDSHMLVLLYNRQLVYIILNNEVIEALIAA